MPTNVAGQPPLTAHNNIRNAAVSWTNSAARLAVLNAHPPNILRMASGIGGTYLCDACSPGSSRVAWACPPYRIACGSDVTGLAG
jgi:hypothetical protein